MSSEAREWHEIVEDVEEVRWRTVGAVPLRYAGCGTDGVGRYWVVGVDPVCPSIAHALCRDKACEWLAQRGVTVAPDAGRWVALLMEDHPVHVGHTLAPDRDICIRLAVDAVLRGKA